MRSNAKRRQLRTDAVVLDATNGGSYSGLVVIGYTDGGMPLYKGGCTSNCTDDAVAVVDGIFPEDDVDGGEEDQASYAYECASDQYCNTNPPGNSFKKYWTFIGMCRRGVDCPSDAYDETNVSYVMGDQVVMTSGYLNGKVIGSISCYTGGMRASGGIMSNNNTVLVPYAYEVETSQVSAASVFLPRLEERILLNLADALMSCIGGGRVDDEAGFDVQGIDSKPDEVAVTEGSCSVSNIDADNCFAISGQMTLLLVPLDDGSDDWASATIAVTEVARAKIQSAMERDGLLSPTMPEIIKVKYLKDGNEDNRVGFSVESSNQPKSNSYEKEGGQASMGVILGSIFGTLLLLILLVLMCVRLRRARSKSRKDTKAELPNLMDDDTSSVIDNRNEKSPGVLAALCASVCNVLLLKFFGKKTMNIPKDGKNESEPNSPGTDEDDDEGGESDDGLDNIIDQIDGATDPNDRRIFVVDPPGAFHLGNHHYTGNGVRYFSPLCELCIAAKANADGVVTVNAINVDDDDESDDGRVSLRDGLSFDLEAATQFVDFNSNDLGRCHSSMHVRTCKSTTCPICTKEKGVYFVKSRGRTGAR